MGDVQVTYDATLENRGQSILTENRYLLKDRWMVPIVSSHCNQILSWLKKLIMQALKLKTFFFQK